jgi:hypothetical protein
MGPTTGSSTFPPGQYRGPEIWINNQGHTCDSQEIKDDINADWTDKTGKFASDYCSKFKPTQPP